MTHSPSWSLLYVQSRISLSSFFPPLRQTNRKSEAKIRRGCSYLCITGIQVSDGPTRGATFRDLPSLETQTSSSQQVTTMESAAKRPRMFKANGRSECTSEQACQWYMLMVAVFVNNHRKGLLSIALSAEVKRGTSRHF